MVCVAQEQDDFQRLVVVVQIQIRALQAGRVARLNQAMENPAGEVSIQIFRLFINFVLLQMRL